MAKSVHCLAAPHTTLIVHGTIDAPKSAHARNLGVFIIFSRERQSLVQAASLAGCLATTRGHHLLGISLGTDAALVLDLTPSTRGNAGTSAAAREVRIHRAPIADIAIQSHSIGASQAPKT